MPEPRSPRPPHDGPAHCPGRRLDRSSTSRAARPLPRLAGALAVVTFTTVALGASSPVSAQDEPPPPPATVNEFIPDDVNLSDCLGALERPGCGSDQRGGWRQTVLFLAIVGALGVIAWRVVVASRRTRAARIAPHAAARSTDDETRTVADDDAAAEGPTS